MPTNAPNDHGEHDRPYSEASRKERNFRDANALKNVHNHAKNGVDFTKGASAIDQRLNGNQKSRGRTA